MVDFNTESIVSAAPKKLIEILILERREYLTDAWEVYYKLANQGVNNQQAVGIVFARLRSLFDKLRPQLKSALPQEWIDKLYEYIASKDIKKARLATDIIEDFLNEGIGLTRLNIVKKYDPTDVEAENAAFGL